MKKLIIYTLMLSTCFVSCKKFLDIKPVGARFLTELDAVKATMGSWMYNFKKNGQYNGTDAPAPWLDYQSSRGSGSFQSFLDVWSFDKWNSRTEPLSAIEKRLIDRTVTRSDWSGYYELVGFMNLIITEGSTAVGEEKKRDIVLGEAYIQRAYYLFKLLQYYAPVNDASMGIPVYTGIHESIKGADLSRKPQAEVWKQIASDLEAAETRLNRTPPVSSFNIMYSRDWLYRIAAQMYQWKASVANGLPEDWAKAVSYAELAIKYANNDEAYTQPLDIDKVNKVVFSTDMNGYQQGEATYMSFNYPEVLYWKWKAPSLSYSDDWTYDIGVWKTLYHDGDKRKTSWFLLPADYNKPSADIVQSDLNATRKFPNFFGYLEIASFRLAEQWLIWIESLAMSGKLTDAQNHLTTWRALRYTSASLASLTMPASAQDMQKEIYLERKREFIGEGDILWLDMKRFNVKQNRKVQDFGASMETYDWRYQLNIPDNELKNNPEIKTNPGWSGAIYN